MSQLSSLAAVLTAAIIVLAALPGVVGAVGDTSTVVTVGPPERSAAAGTTDVTGEIILEEGREMAAAGGASGSVAVTLPEAVPVEGRKIVREVGKKK